MIINITDFRRQLFDVTTRLLKTGDELEVERNGQRIFRVVPIKEDSPSEKAKYALKHILPKVAGMWKDVPAEEFDKMDEYFRGKKMKEYMKKIRRAW